MENGNICDYLKANPAAPRIPLVCAISCPVDAIPLLTVLEIREITLGLDYLHQRRIVHGDLKGVSKSVIRST